MKSRKRKRSAYVVRYVAARAAWAIFQDGNQVGGTYWNRKADAVAQARRVARQDPPSELIITTKAGRIGRGSTSRSTYGADPRKSKG